MATNVTDVIENAGFGRYQILILVMCGIMIFFDGYDLLSISFTAPEFIKLLGIDRSMIGPVFSAGLFGLTVGALSFGLLGDRVGPSRTFLFCCVMFGIFSLLTAFATSLTELLVVRFLAGLALGGASPISVAIASNYCPKLNPHHGRHDHVYQPRGWSDRSRIHLCLSGRLRLEDGVLRRRNAADPAGAAVLPCCFRSRSNTW